MYKKWKTMFINDVINIKIKFVDKYVSINLGPNLELEYYLNSEDHHEPRHNPQYNKKYNEIITNCTYPLTNMMYNRPQNNDYIIDTYYKKAAAYFGSSEINKTWISWKMSSQIVRSLMFSYEFKFENNVENKYINDLGAGYKRCSYIIIRYYVSFEDTGEIERESYHYNMQYAAGSLRIKLVPCGDKIKIRKDYNNPYTIDYRNSHFCYHEII